MSRLTFLIVILPILVALVGCKKPGTIEAAPGELLLHQQEILYDLRGASIDKIVLNETQVFFNNTASPVSARLEKVLTAGESRDLDLEEWFGVMGDLLPAKTPIALDKCVQLPNPQVVKAADGTVKLKWQAELAPNKGAILKYNLFWLDGRSIYTEDGRGLVLPLVRVQAESSLQPGELKLNYRLKNTATVPIERLKFAVFLPSQARTGTGEPVSLYRVDDYASAPKADTNSEILMADGTLNMVRGTYFSFSLPDLAPGKETTAGITCRFQRTGAHGTIVPYGQVLFRCGQQLAPAVAVTVTQQQVKVRTLPTVYLSNVGYPDVTRFNF